MRSALLLPRAFGPVPAFCPLTAWCCLASVSFSLVFGLKQQIPMGEMEGTSLVSSFALEQGSSAHGCLRPGKFVLASERCSVCKDVPQRHWPLLTRCQCHPFSRPPLWQSKFSSHYQISSPQAGNNEGQGLHDYCKTTETERDSGLPEAAIICQGQSLETQFSCTDLDTAGCAFYIFSPFSSSGRLLFFFLLKNLGKSTRI